MIGHRAALVIRKRKASALLAWLIFLLGITLLWGGGMETARAAGALEIQLHTAPNLVVDSNVTAPSTYSPNAATVQATFCNTGDADLTQVFAYVGNGTTAGTYPVLDSATLAAATYPKQANTGSYSLTHEGGSAGTADATRYLGTLAPQQCLPVYWLVSYPRCVNRGSGADATPVEPPCSTASLAGGSTTADDIDLGYQVWGTASGIATMTKTGTFTLRSELSASANKIEPNGDNKVPQEYVDALSTVQNR